MLTIGAMGRHHFRKESDLEIDVIYEFEKKKISKIQKIFDVEN